MRVKRNHASQRSLRAELQGFCIENGKRALRRRGIVKDGEQQASVFGAANFGDKISFSEVYVRGAPRGNDVTPCSWSQGMARKLDANAGTGWHRWNSGRRL